MVICLENMIHKQILKTVDVQEITVPSGAKILSVGEQRGVLCVWYCFNNAAEESAPTKKIAIRIVGTGSRGPGVTGFTFIDTVICSNGLVWHVFYDE